LNALSGLKEDQIDSYLQDFECRFNGRKNEYLFRDTLTRLLDPDKI